MTDREKLTKLVIAGMDEWHEHSLDICEVGGFLGECNRGEYDREEYIADYLIAHGVTVQWWRPGSEPPKGAGHYIAITQDGTYPRELFWSAKRQKWVEVSDGDFDTAYVVTHWMPMPEPPEEDKHE